MASESSRHRNTNTCSNSNSGMMSSSSKSSSSRGIGCYWMLVLVASTLLQCQKSAAFASSLSQQHCNTVVPVPVLRLSKANRKSRVILTTTSSEEAARDADSSSKNDDETAEAAAEARSEVVRMRGGSGTVGRNAPPAMPTLRQYAKFAFPCLALWVAGPLLSLVDTSFVGLSKGNGLTTSAQQLAALGPATTLYVLFLFFLILHLSSLLLRRIHSPRTLLAHTHRISNHNITYNITYNNAYNNSFDGATYLFAFLNVATTNLYSSARAQDGPDSETAESVVRTSAQVALKSGLWLMLFMLVFTRPLLRLYIGDKAASTPGLLDSATDYVCIRALSMPTSLLLGVLQAALLGAKDSVTPLIAILYSTIVNVCGDYLLVSRFHFGLQGAAVATTLAQWAATAALIPAARQKLVKSHNLGLFTRRTKATENADTYVSGRAFLSFAAPVLTLILGKIAAFGFMTHSAAAAPGQPTPLASHQIILSLLFFCSPFLEVLSQTAQTFLPPFLAPVKEHVAASTAKDAAYDVNADTVVEPWVTAGQKVATSLLGIGLFSAAVIASLASLVPAFFGNWITTDTIIQEAVKPLAKYLWLGAFFWAPVAVAEGVLLARLELKFLAGIYLVSTALLPPALLRVKFQQGNVGQVWGCFVVFQIFRAIMFTGRIWGGFAMQRIFGKHPPKEGKSPMPRSA